MSRLPPLRISTLVIAGTAGAVHHQNQKWVAQDAQLQQLAQLHTAGVLTDEEFAAAKSKLLAG
jgi:hypothetical protein